jgi:hypothetical protein
MAIELGDFLERTSDGMLFKVIEIDRFHTPDARYGPSGVGYEYILRTRDDKTEVKLDSADHLEHDWFRATDPADPRCW